LSEQSGVVFRIGQLPPTFLIQFA